MRRFRMMSAKEERAWRSTREMAKQDAIRAGLGYRDAISGIATLAPQVRLEVEDGEADCSGDDLLEGDALAVLVVHGREAERFIRRQLLITSDTTGRDRWRAVLASVETLRREAGEISLHPRIDENPANRP